MKKLFLLVTALSLLVVLLMAGTAMAAVQQGVLVQANGLPLTGYSNVWIVDGVAQPIYNPTTDLWYPVYILGPGPNGAILCTVEPPLGVIGDKFWNPEPMIHFDVDRKEL
jgi:hypothetical protein